MNFQEIADRIQNQPRQIWEYYIDSDDPLLEELDIPRGLFGYDCVPAPLITMRSVQTWTCTDTQVGLDMIYLDNEPVALQFQRYRKSDPEFLWRDQAARDQMAEYILSLARPVYDPKSNFSIADSRAIKGICDWIDAYEFKEHFRNNLS